jgi:CelD/BcsL family acetyltransferase involved in cellulose biosynthesis
LPTSRRVGGLLETVIVCEKELGVGITVAIEPCPEPQVLADLWRSLEDSADGSFFLSWSWIGAVIACFGPPAALVVARRHGEVVGLGLLGRRDRCGWDVLRTPSLHLNESGRPDCDAVMIEYNGLLARRGDEGAVAVALLRALTGRGGPPWRELHLSGVGPEAAEHCRGQGLAMRVLKHHVAPYVDLGGTDPLEALSRNARQQIRRSLRLYEERGPLTLDRAADVAEAWAWLDDLACAHTKAWQARGLPGAFANPHFRPFHRWLIADGFSAGAIDLLRVRAGGETIGMLYNFRHRGMAYSYQSGFRYEADERLKPGLVSHVLALRRYHGEGLSTYRLLAGDSRYKNTLATGKDDLLWLVAHRRDLPHGLEAVARRLVSAVRRKAPHTP